MAAASPAADDVLMICDRRFPIDFEREGLPVAGTAVRVLETPNSGQGTAHSVWDGAVVLAKHLEYCHVAEIGGARVAELGSGTGLAGLSALAIGASAVVLSDLEYAMASLRWAVDTGPDSWSTKLAEAVVADWSKPAEAAETIAAAAGGGPPDCVLLADVVWVDELVEPLVECLHALCTLGTDGGEASHRVPSVCPAVDDDGRGPLVVMAHQTRSEMTDQAFFRRLARDFVWQQVPPGCLERVPRGFRAAGPLALFEARLKPVPEP